MAGPARDNADWSDDAQARAENFPVASRLLPPQRRADAQTIYACLRLADDIADRADTPLGTKLAALDQLERAATLGDGPAWAAPAEALGRRLAAARLDLAPLRDVLEAFRWDSRGIHCQRWDDLMAYCGLSAAPVADLVLGLAGARAAAYPPARELAKAFQVLDHLQDLAPDYTWRGRVYLPIDWLAEAGGGAADLAQPASTPAVRAAKRRALRGCDRLLAQAAPLPARLRGTGLAAQSRVTLALGRALRQEIAGTDPLVQTPRLSPVRAAWVGALSLLPGRGLR